MYQLSECMPETGDTQAQHISKRDYIATQIVAGIMANPSLCREGHEFMVRAAYKLADAMIRESKR